MTNDEQFYAADMLLMTLKSGVPVSTNDAQQLIELGTNENEPFHDIMDTLRRCKAMHPPRDCMTPSPTEDY